MLRRPATRCRHVLIFSALCAALWVAVTPAVSLAASSTRILTKTGGSVFVTAASMFGDSEAQTVELVGDVHMTFDGQTLRCDRAKMNKNTGMILAEGGLIIASPSAYVEGTRAELSYETNTGIIYNGFVKTGQVLLEGEVIRKVGPVDYQAERASYTACTTCPPAWKFSGSNINAEIGGYAYIKSSWFYLGGLPVLWLPYLIVPLKSERQTGVLFPNYEVGSDEFAAGLPFFWAISRSQDLTIEPKFYTKRGLKGLFNYRFVYSEESAGSSSAGLIRDKVFASDGPETDRPGAERSDRWFLHHDHFYVLPGGFINRANLNFVSDLRYPRDFPLEIPGRGDPALENRFSLTKNSERLHASIEADYYINLLKSKVLDGNADSVHRFPEFKQSGVDRSLFGTRGFLRWDFNYVNFAREDIAFDDVILTGGTPSKRIDQSRSLGSAGSGSFEPNVDIIRTGQRLDLKPELSIPFRLGPYLDVLPSIGLRHTQYSFNVKAPSGTNFDPTPSRQFVRTRLALRTQISRVYELALPVDESTENEPEAPATGGIFSALQPPPPLKRQEKIKHEIEPEISISGIPWLHQTDSPFFGQNSLSPIFLEGEPVSDSDFTSARGLQFDYEDRITQRNIVSALVDNRFIKKSWSGEKANYRQIISIKTGTSYEYDKYDRQSEANFSNVFNTIEMRLGYFDTNTTFRYFPLHRVVDTSARARVIDPEGRYIQASFTQKYQITENVSEAYPLRSEVFSLVTGFSHRYGAIAAQFDYQPVGYEPIDFRVKSWTLTFDLRPPGNCWGVRAYLKQDLGEELRSNFALDYNFGGGGK